MVAIVTKAVEKTNAFDGISEFIANGLLDLKNTLHQENEKWCVDIGDELETNIKNWLATSDKIEQAELEEKEKLKLVLSRFEDTVEHLIREATLLEANS
ncbi:hypothetical protein ABW20_dc0102526 [Dactylellina cionopaga]|nr:hypothetical protein ABW20_dc0102526 [Dactylellina cionopaga]